MVYLWLFLGALAVVCAVALSISGLVRYAAKSVPMSSPVLPIAGIVLAAAYFFAATPLWMNKDWLFPFAGLAVLCALLALQLRATGVLKEVGLVLVSLGSCYLLPTDGALFKSLGADWAYPVLAVSLYVMMHLFIMMDRVPWFSNLTLMAQGILILFLIQRNILPAEVSYPLFFAFVATIAVAQTVKVYFGVPVLGDFAATIAGFVLGYLWTFVISQGFWGIPPVLYSYAALEVCISFICSCVAAKRLAYPIAPFFVEQAMDTGLNPNRLIRAVFFVLVFLSLLALANLTPDIWQSVLVLLGIGLFATCFQFKRWSVPRVRFRDLGSDLKQGFSELKNEMMTVPLKKNTPKGKGRKK